jgi:Nucleotide modification associated domain 2
MLTLATCKPGIRRTKRIGDWIAGFTSQELNRDRVGHERLIFLMKVTDIIDQYRYYRHQDFQSKIPKIDAREIRDRAGDNIYRPIVDDPQSPVDFEQIPNPNHDRTQQCDDLSGRRVLVVASRVMWKINGAFFRLMKCTTSRPSWQAATGGMRHGQEHQGCCASTRA